LVATLCSRLTAEEDPAFKRESHEWCLNAYQDTPDAQIQELLRIFRKMDAAATPPDATSSPYATFL
jgi:hypothetical protein